MLPIDFEEANITIGPPRGMTDEECMGVRAYKDVDDAGYPFVLTMWNPSKEDLDALNAGRPLLVKMIGHTMQPISLYTYDENKNANV